MTQHIDMSKYRTLYTICIAELSPYLATKGDATDNLDIVFLTIPATSSCVGIQATPANTSLASLTKALYDEEFAGILFPILTKRKFRNEVVMKLHNIARTLQEGVTLQ